MALHQRKQKTKKYRLSHENIDLNIRTCQRIFASCWSRIFPHIDITDREEKPLGILRSFKSEL